MKNPTKILRLAILAVLLMSGVQMSAYDFYSGGIYYDISSSGVTVVNKGSFNTYSGYVTIPETVSYNGQTYTVITIGYQAFKNCTGLTNVSIPNTVWGISNEAFAGCTSLTSIVLPTSLTAMYNNVFVGCTNLRSIYARRTEPRSASTNNFDASTYSSATLFVPEEAYEAYKTTAPWSSFTNIKKTNYDFVVDGLYYHKTSSNTVELTYRDENYNSYSGGIIIPKTVVDNGTTYRVTAIGKNAFRSCSNLSDVSLNVNIKTIGDYAFWSCTNMTNIFSMPSGLTSIGNYAFNMCSALKSITIPSNVTTIGTAAFSGCTTIQSITIPNKVTSIGNNTFMGCTALKNLTIGTGLTEISYQMFDGCSALTNVIVPDNITKIKTFAFRSCTSLTEVTLGSGLTSLDTSPFKGCTSLTKVTSLATTPPTMENSGCFESSTYASATLKVPGASVSAYKSADWWRMFGTIDALSFDFCVNGIYYKKVSNLIVKVTYKDMNFNTYSGNISIPATIRVNNSTYMVTSIGEFAFYMCNNLTSVSMPSTITLIDNCAFEKCTSLTSVTIPSSVTQLGVDAFSSCSALKSIDIPNSVSEIGQLAFYNCTAMTTATIGDGVTNIGQQAFGGCSALNTITCKAVNPPTMANKNCFDNNTYNTATLNVPKRSLNAYKSADWWRIFTNIVGGDFGGKPGDVNGDGEVNIADVNAEIAAILSSNYDTNNDVNGDGEVNIADVNAIIDAILSK